MENRRISPDLEASSSNSKYGYGEPRPLNLGCRIFISHSGRDKNFVRHLHYHLVNKVYCDKKLVFFDEESLPTAEPISMENILAEARGCELGILVLTEDFFMNTRNPMLELEALTSSNVQLLPLFFGISVDEFKKMKCENEWEERWKEWLKGDKQRLGVWKYALDYVDQFSGLEKCKLGNNELDYIHKIVDKVVLIVRPDVSFSEKGVCGMDRICKKVNNMYIQCASKRTSHCQTQVVSASVSTVWGGDSNSSLDLVGIYGFAGLGKSTLCRGLCDYYDAEFCGRVFWLELGSVPTSSQALSQTYSSESAHMLHMQSILSRLIGHSDCRLRGYNDYPSVFETQNLFQNWVRRDPIFLAIDNISSDSEALEEARFYLDCEFAAGSKVFLTSRNVRLLECLMREHIKFSAVIERIPALRIEEAIDIFVREISKSGQISDAEDDVKECVSMCVIHKGVKLHHKHDKDEWYHPLMLKSSAASIRRSRKHNVDLKSKLREFLQSVAAVDTTDALKTVFDMLDITYAILGENEKKVFHDLALFYYVGKCNSNYEWIQTLHSHLGRKTLDDILWSLDDLSFIVLVQGDLGGGNYVQLHDLMVDYALYKMKQGVATGFNPQFLLLDNGTQLTNSAFDFLFAKAGVGNEWPSESNALKSVRTIGVSRWDKCHDSGAQVSEQLDLRNFEGVEVLHLVDNPGLHEVLLSCNTIAHLRSFIVKVPRDSVLFRCTIDECWPMPNRMMTGGQLVWVELEGNIILSTRRKRSWWQEQLCRLSRRHSMDGLGILRPFLCNLQYLALSNFPAKSIDVTTCTNLIRMRLQEMPSLRVIHGLETLTNLKELHISRCDPEIIDVTTCTNLEEMTLCKMSSLRAVHAVETLTDLHISECRSLERISLPRLSNAGKLAIYGCPVLKNAGGLLLDQCFGDCRFCGVAIQDLVSVEIGSSKFKATVTVLELSEEKRVQGLARLKEMIAKDVQHVGPFISALLKVEASCLHSLRLWCKEDGDCGCDKIGPHLGPGLLPLRIFEYRCPQVRSIASMPLLFTSRLKKLDLWGCRNVEVWPDFATMTSLIHLDLSHTSLKEWPTGVQLLRQLRVLEIEGCWQLPAEEMMNAITCNPLGCNSACGRGSLASLLADLKNGRRDRGSVADALDSRWPEIASLFHEQWRYLRYPWPGTLCPLKHVGFQRHTELCYLIRVMYDLWFGVEGQAGSAHKDCCPSVDGVPRINEKLKRLLCSESFMSLPFYVWRIGRTRVHALDEWEWYPWQEGYEIYMAFALLGSASIGCFNAPLNDDLKDRMVNFIQSCVEAQPQHAVNNDFDMSNVQLNITAERICYHVEPDYFHRDYFDGDYIDRDAHERLAMRVGDAVCQMARAPSVAAALGQDFKFKHITVDGLKASYNTIEVPDEDVYENLIKWMRFTSCHLHSRLVRLSCLIAKVDKASVHTMSLDDDLGARVLQKIMPKILSISSLDFHGAIDGVNDENCCCRESECNEKSHGKCDVQTCCYSQKWLITHFFSIRGVVT